MRRGRTGRGDLVGRAAEWTANHMGSPRFLISMTVFIVVWVSINTIAEFDPHLFVLNLLFSTMASYAAPLIMLAQNRTANRDKTLLAHDRATNRQARSDMDYLSSQIAQLNKSLADLPTRKAIRDDITTLTTELKTSASLRELVRQSKTR